MINPWLIILCVEYFAVHSASNYPFCTSLNQVWFRIHIYTIVSNTLRSVRRASSYHRKLIKNNICHVVYAYEMLASDQCYLARVCVGLRLCHDSIWAHPWEGIHIQFARVNAYYDEARYKSLIACENMTRWNITQQYYTVSTTKQRNTHTYNPY